MSEENFLGTQLVRFAGMFSATIFAWAIWLSRGSAFGDFRVLHLGARLINEGRIGDAYDPDAFQQEAIAEPTLEAAELLTFLSTPPFALAMRPFAFLSSNAALGVWLVLGVLAFFAAVRLLNLPWWTGLAAIVLPTGLANIQLGQTGFFALLMAAAIHRLCVEDKVVAAGVVAGFAVLKPTLLLGVAIWWLLDWRKWHKALLSAAGVGTLLVLPTVVGGFEQWRLFLGALEARSAFEFEIVSHQPTIAEIVNRSFGTDIGGHPIASALYLVVGAVAMRAAIRRWPERTDVLSGAAILVSVLVSPHLLIYDATLIIIPFAVLVHAGSRGVERDRLVAIFLVTALMSILPMEPFSTINDYVIPTAIGLIVASVYWAWLIDKGDSAPALLDVPSMGTQLDEGLADEGLADAA